MPSDDYTAFSGGGALKLKGGKVSKSKKKKKDKAAGLEHALSTGEPADSKELEKPAGKKKSPRDDERPEEEDEHDEPIEYKTEAQKRHEEYKRKKMLELAQSSSSRPELLKTHKERVEELNTYLSKLSEHHDMPKIGPG
ncbi:hypothetical protein PFICI_07435 [Pestalotiopsis fici W106-1]|uniref:DUF1754-domain-containing protein n=1 Tax=Pestalotiopsis fici (strain W106-1 / CGMCC3.15140) TaxID=1229662 RepID=W3X408_PESFW|nr:uncharacterized protein PFICI_07435 [Pestalotiopsis fici W106-1]ETS79906.1 hypothetical protein PFICI_07435 [Pestalotiopsis fici W106-1]